MRSAVFVLFATAASALGPVERWTHWHAHHQLIGEPAAVPARGTPDVTNCTLNWFQNTIDHFNFDSTPTGATSFAQRYFTYSQYWNPSNGTIFFYVGNEADVTLYVNHTGLMWSNAAQFNAMLVFAEHRYFGLSQPFGGASGQFPQYLTHEQAMADYVALIDSLQANLSAVPGWTGPQPVIAFGGSYGGMLAAWIRQKYPSSIAGSIAASAPIQAFPGLSPAFNNNSYWQVVTNDATAAGGAPAACAANVRAAFAAILNAGNSAAGLANLSSTFAMCPPLQSPTDAANLAAFHLNAWDSMAMGSYPYPSSYMTGGVGVLPAYPLRAACQYLAEPTLASGDPWALLAAFQAAGNVFNNVTQNVACYTLPSDPFYDGIWDALYCGALLPEETFFDCNGVTDMFYQRHFPIHPFVDNKCFNQWGYKPRELWIRQSYGNRHLGATNIVFSNGLLDPWSSGGVTSNNGPGTSVLLIPEMGHHVDLFFADPADTPALTAARQAEVSAIAGWIAAFRAEQAAAKQEL